MSSHVFVLDLNRCTGCQACRLACSIENRLEPHASWRQIVTYNPAHRPGSPTYHLSLACNHCREAACKKGCPSLAISRRADSGAILVDPARCLGCGYCTWVCPFDAAQIDPGLGIMKKCTLCHPRLVRGEAPACVLACPTGALNREEEGARETLTQVPGFAPAKLQPGLRFVALRPQGTRPEILSTSLPPDNPLATGLSPATPGGQVIAGHAITLRGEWPLVVFSLLMAGLVSAATAAAVGALRLSPVLFLTTAALAMGAGTRHLRKPLRAWRAIRNIRRSWLSREIALTLGFVMAAGGACVATARMPPGQALPGWVAALSWLGAVVGFGALFAIDRVYGAIAPGTQGGPRPLDPENPTATPAASPRFPTHSAEVLLTGTMLVAVLTRTPEAAALFAALKLLLWARRKKVSGQPLPATLPVAGVIRVGVGLLLPAFLWWVFGGPHGLIEAVILAAVAAGEVTDRIEFYAEIEVASPALAMRRHLDEDARGADHWGPPRSKSPTTMTH